MYSKTILPTFISGCFALRRVLRLAITNTLFRVVFIGPTDTAHINVDCNGIYTKACFLFVVFNVVIQNSKIRMARRHRWSSLLLAIIATGHHCY